MKTHEPVARNVDRPVAGLIKDLKSRGLFEDTLIVFTTEFGPQPYGGGKLRPRPLLLRVFILAGRGGSARRYGSRQDG
jgi:arylsulfatase A-like enzyme